MNSVLNAPDLQRSYSISADWLELRTLAQAPGAVNVEDILQPHDILEDPRAPQPEGMGGVPRDAIDILDTAAEEMLNAICEELDFRSRVLEMAYPFRLSNSTSTSPLRVDVASDDENICVMQGRKIYIACLYMSTIRAGLIDARVGNLRGHPAIGDLFQICATIAAAGYVHGDAYWFGHPRPDRTTMVAAVRTLADLLGQGVPGNQTPTGETRYAKDGGVDVVAWRPHHDGRPAKLILYGQCASGMDWVGKSVAPKVARMDGYYSRRPSQHWLPALLTPFPLYMDKENSHSLTTEEARHGFYLVNEGEMGVIIDRLRVVHWCMEGLRNPQPSMNAAIEKLDDVFGWSNEARRTIGLMT